MILCRRRRAPSPASMRSISSSSSAGTTRCGDRLSTVNGPATRTLALVLIGAVVEQFDVGRLGDRGVDLLLAGDARLPPLRMRLLRPRRAMSASASRGISHSSNFLPSAAFSCARSGSSFACHFS